MMVKIILLILIIFLGSLTSATITAASSEPTTTVKVDQVAGLTGKLIEKATLLLKFNDQDKANYYRNLTEKRLAELELTIKRKDYQKKDFLIEQTSSRYASYVGVTADFIIKHKLSQPKELFLKDLVRHKQILAGLRDNFPANSGWWLLVAQDIDTTDIFSDQLKAAFR